MTVSKKTGLIRFTCYSIVLSILGFMGFLNGSANAAVDDNLIMSEMRFIEKIAAYGYFDLAKKARDNAKQIPGLTEKQKTFLDLVQSQIAVSEIKEEADLKKREAKLNSTIAYLKKVISDLPEGSQLIIQAKSKLILTYGSAADVFMDDVDTLDLKVKMNPKDAAAFKKEKDELLKLARKTYASGAKQIGALRNEMLDMFNLLAEKYTGEEENKQLKDKYYKLLETAFSQQVEFEHKAAEMYVNYARSQPRGSKQRSGIFEEAYWFNADIEEFHKQYIPNDILESLTFIQLAGLMDDPVAEDNADGGNNLKIITAAAGVPNPIDLMTNIFKDKIVGDNKGRTAKSGQEVRANALLEFAKSWYRMAKGANQKYLAAKDPAAKQKWDAHVDRCIDNCKKVYSETQKGARSVIGDIPLNIKKKGDLFVRLPLAIFEAERAKAKNQTAELPSKLAGAKGLCSQLLLSKDVEVADAAKKQLEVINAYYSMWVPNYDPDKLTAGEAMAQGDNLYERYLDEKTGGVADSKLKGILSEMFEKFLAAERLLKNDRSITPAMRIDYTAKCWYQIGLSSLLLEDYYIAYIANQHLLQVFRGERYTADTYPEVEKYREYAARNVVAAAYRQRKETNEAFDRKLYAQSLIWRITYETSKDPDKVKDFYYVVGDQYSKIGLYREGYEWLSKTPEDSKLVRLSYLTRGNTALKMAKQLKAEIKADHKKIARIEARKPKMTKPDLEEADSLIKELQAEIKDKTDESKVWLERAEKDAGTFLKLLSAFEKKYGSNIPPQFAASYEEEKKNKYAAYLLYMQIKFSEEDYEAVRKTAEIFRKQEIPEDNRKNMIVKTGWMELIANLDAVDNEKADVAEVTKWLENGQKIVDLIDKNAEGDDGIAMQSKMLMGSRWLNLAARVDEAMPEKASAYRRKAGEMFSQVKGIINKDVRFAIMVGRIFTDEAMYDDAEEIYDLGLKIWDKEEKYPSLVEKDEFKEETKTLYATALARVGDAQKARKLSKLHDELYEMVYGERPNFYEAQAKIAEIKNYAKEIAVDMMKKSPTDEMLTKLNKAIEYRSYILNIKRNLVLAKVALEKWQEALALLDTLLEHFKYDATFKILKGDVYYAMAKKKATYEEAKEQLDYVTDLCKTLTIRTKIKVKGPDGKTKYVENKEKLPKFSKAWWETYGLYYQVQAVDIVKQKGKKGIDSEAAKLMKNIKLWQDRSGKKGPYTPSGEFMDRADIAYNMLEEAGFSKMTVSDERIKQLEEEANKREAEMRKKREEKLIRDLRKPVDQAVFLKGEGKVEQAKAIAAEKKQEIEKAIAESGATDEFKKELQGYLAKLKGAGLIE